MNKLEKVFKKLFLVILSVIYFMINMPLKAETKDDGVYMIKNVPIRATAENATKAKSLALKNGQRRALKTVFEKKHINTGYTKFISDNLISEMIETVKITDEIMTVDSYSSKITIVFSKEFLNYNLKKYNMDTGKVVDNMFLYIPLYEKEDGSIDMFDSKNIWYESAYNRYFEKVSEYNNIVLIDNYDLANAGLLPSKKVINNPDYNLFQNLLIKYNCNTVVIAIAKYNKREDSVDIRFIEIDADSNNEKALTFSNKNNNNEPLEEASIRTLDFLNQESKIRVLQARKDKKELDKIMMDKYIDVFYVIPNLREYITFKKIIDNLDFISKCEIVQLTTKIVCLRLYYKIDEGELMPKLKNRGFIISSKYGRTFINYEGF